ncbi:hypothetical protein CKA32_002169 [Geitlerinema sp. FC II]|nr:hypothetical protein CKA32_002169 [Geitlerinema sp. FC II]
MGHCVLKVKWQTFRAYSMLGESGVYRKWEARSRRLVRG